VHLQEQVGLAVVTDGEFRRSSYWARFVERIEGFAIGQAAYSFRDESGCRTPFTAPFAEARLRRVRELALDEFLFLRQVARVTPKITLPAPSTMHFYAGRHFTDPQIYGDTREFFADLTLIFRQEIDSLGKAGCPYVQFDEVAIAMLCDPLLRERAKSEGEDADTLIDLYIDAINQALARYGRRRSRLPRQFQRTLSVGRWLRGGRGAIFRGRKCNAFPAGIRYDARWRFCPVAFRSEGQRRGARSY